MADHGDGNMLEIEKQRAARMAENKKRMMELFGGVDTSFMAPAPRATPKTIKRIKREPGSTPAEGYRKSDRIQKLPAKPIYVVDDWTERAPKQRKPGRTGRGSTSGTCRAERGWHPGLGMASEAAGEAATDAAIERREELLADKRIAYVKLLSFSQVAGGFWEQLPRGMHSHYGHVNKLHITLHCDDQRHAGSYRNCEEGSSSKWSVVYLPRENHTAGLSGGWVGFAIDQKLFPNDTVVFEFMDKHNMRAHLYRAHDYETPETARWALQPQVVISVAAGPSNSSAAPAAATQTTATTGAAAAAAGGAAANAEAGASGSGAEDAGAENAAKPGSRKAAAAGAAAVGGGVAKRRRAAQAKVSPGPGLVLGDVTNSDALPGGQLMQQQEGQEADEQQQQEVEVEEQIAGVSEGDVSGRDQGHKAPKNQPCKTAGQKRSQPEAAADCPGAAAGATGAAAVPPARKRTKAAAAGDKGVAVSAAAAAQGGTVASGAKKGSKASTAARNSKDGKGGRGSKASTGGKGGKSRAGKGAGGGAGQGEGGAGELAGPDEFDEEAARCAARGEKKRWYKTAAEQRKEQAESQFWVRKILGTRLQAGTRQFKVRWWGFSPAWDSWEPVECLDKPPATYPWAVPIPPEVCSM